MINFLYDKILQVSNMWKYVGIIIHSCPDLNSSWGSNTAVEVRAWISNNNPQETIDVIVLFHHYFPPSGEQPKKYILAHKSTNCRLYGNISQILLLYKIWG